MSNQIGSNVIVISSTDSVWANRGIKTQNGILFIVSVRANTDSVTYQLGILGPSRASAQFTNILANGTLTGSLGTTNSPATYQVYRYINWGNRDFNIFLTGISGSSYIMLSRFSEQDNL